MRASVVAIKNTSVSFGEYVFSFFTLMVINAIVIVPAVLILRELLKSVY